MRKHITIVLAVVLLVAVVSTVFAAETTFEGAYRVRSIAEWNFDKEYNDVGNTPTHEDGLYTGFFDQRFRLTITHTRSEYLRAVVRLDIAEDVWGRGAAMRINGGNADYIDRAYIEFTVPPVGTFTVGRFFEGYGNLFTFDTAGDGARWNNAWGPVAVSLSYFKVSDRETVGPAAWEYNWDADVVGLDVLVTPIEGHVLEIYGGVLWDEDASGSSGLGGVLGNSRTLISPFAEYEAWVGFVGVGYTGNFADMIDVNVEASWLFGEATGHYTQGMAGNPDPFGGYTGALYTRNARRSLDIYGWNVYADVSYYNDLFRVGAAFMMGSGQKHWWVNPNLPPNFISISHVNMNFITNDGDFSVAHIITGGHNDGRSSVWGGGLFGANTMENITAIKGYFEVCPMDKLTISGAVIWAKWTEAVGINAGTRGALFAPDSPAYFHPVIYYAGENYRYNSWEVSDDLGWEIDLALSYEIMEGLTYSFEGAVLFTGDSFDYEKDDGTRGEWGEIWSFFNTLQYEF